MSQEVRPPELEDALRRLALTLGPIANAAENSPVRPETLPAARRLRFGTVIVVLVTALIAAAILTTLPFRRWHSNSEPAQTVAVRTPHDNDVAQLRSALAEAEEEQRRLRTELEEARKPKPPLRWFEDANMLSYRNPWVR